MTIGIVGAGQLGRMLALAGYPLGLDFLCLDPSSDAPAGQVAPLLSGSFTDHALLAELARRCEVVTFDWENVPVAGLRAMQRAHGARIAPPVAALECGQDRVSEKRLFTQLAIPTTRWRAVDSRAELEAAIAAVGLPGVLKTRRLGYDGKGQALLRRRADAGPAWERLGSAPLLYEEWVPFEHEVSVIGARGARNQVVIYPLCGNVHGAGILRVTCAPYGPPRWREQAARHLRRVLAHFRYRGILTIEFFVRAGELIANEMAPRVHNSGHWTIEGAATSQFENHLRAILGLPLGATRALGHSAMINLIGRIPPRARLLALEGVHLHDYGKQPRPGRKVGHCTVVEPTAARRDARARGLAAKLAAGVRIP